MTMPTTFTWIVTGLFGAMLVAGLIVGQTKRFQEKQVLTFWQRVGLPMGTEQINQAVRRRLHRSGTAAAIGGLAGFLVSLVVLLFTPNPSYSFGHTWLVVLPAVVIGMTVFDVALSLRDCLFVQRPNGPRMARLASVSTGDYMSPWRLRAAPSLLVLGIILAAAGPVLGVAGVIELQNFLGSNALVFLVLAVVVLAGCRAVVPRILLHSQPVTDTLELAWDDAIRADTFRKLGLLATIMAWLSVSAIGLAIVDGVFATRPDELTPAIWQVSAMWGYFTIPLLFGYGKSYSYFRHRLWPEFTAVGAGAARKT